MQKLSENKKDEIFNDFLERELKEFKDILNVKSVTLSEEEAQEKFDFPGGHLLSIGVEYSYANRESEDVITNMSGNFYRILAKYGCLTTEKMDFFYNILGADADTPKDEPWVITFASNDNPLWIQLKEIAIAQYKAEVDEIKSIARTLEQGINGDEGTAEKPNHFAEIKEKEIAVLIGNFSAPAPPIVRAKERDTILYANINPKIKFSLSSSLDVSAGAMEISEEEVSAPKIR